MSQGQNKQYYLNQKYDCRLMDCYDCSRFEKCMKEMIELAKNDKVHRHE